VAKGKPGQGEQPIIVIRKKKGHAHGHHGGSWKVALADFMTAMMAFFLLLWLLETATPKELQAIAGYFQAPASRHVLGPGGADAAAIELKAPMEENPQMVTDQSSPLDSAGILGDTPDNMDEESRREEAALAEVERQQLEALEEQLRDEINNTASALNVLKDQIRMELTELGLSIQIIDKERRNMFDEGSAILKPYSEDALYALAPIINKVPNSISIVGHTDAKPYSAGSRYTNWELSTDRANSARRALLEGLYPEQKVVAVQGMAAIAPLVPEKPLDPSNRRIAIIVLKKAVEEAMRKVDPTVGQHLLPSKPRVMSELEIEQAIERERANAPRSK